MDKQGHPKVGKVLGGRRGWAAELGHGLAARDVLARHLSGIRALALFFAVRERGPGGWGRIGAVGVRFQAGLVTSRSASPWRAA